MPFGLNSSVNRLRSYGRLSTLVPMRLFSGPRRRQNRTMSHDPVVRSELRSAVEARAELGEEMEPAVIDAFLDRIERRLAERAGEDQFAIERRREHQKEMVLGSMAISIPLLVVAAVFTGIAGVIAVCIALIVIAAITARG
jgi:hypothetical protein